MIKPQHLPIVLVTEGGAVYQGSLVGVLANNVLVESEGKQLMFDTDMIALLSTCPAPVEDED
jgi:hypothetical protein